MLPDGNVPGVTHEYILPSSFVPFGKAETRTEHVRKRDFNSKEKSRCAVITLASFFHASLARRISVQQIVGEASRRHTRETRRNGEVWSLKFIMNSLRRIPQWLCAQNKKWSTHATKNSTKGSLLFFFCIKTRDLESTGEINWHNREWRVSLRIELRLELISMKNSRPVERRERFPRSGANGGQNGRHRPLGAFNGMRKKRQRPSSDDKNNNRYYYNNDSDRQQRRKGRGQKLEGETTSVFAHSLRRARRSVVSTLFCARDEEKLAVWNN